MSNVASLYGVKDASYFGQTCTDLIEYIVGDDLTILEVGCAMGATGKTLLENGKAKWVTGIEFVEEYADIAKSVLNEVYVGDIEAMTFDWQPKKFDCFIFGDVLEHLSNPWRVLRNLRPFLSDEGIVVASIPNVKHWPVMFDLIARDDWKYNDWGVLDITHLRFFTRKSAQRLFSECGYMVERIEPMFNGRRYSIPSRFTFGLLDTYFAQRWIMRLRLD